MKTVAIIVTYNRIEKLKRCVEALQTYSSEADILIVNNASTDGTSEWLTTITQEERISVLNLDDNIGGAGGFCEGVRWGVENSYDRLWLMDDDCYVNSGTLSRLLEADNLLNGEYGWLSSVALWTDGTPCLMNRQKTTKDFYPNAHLLANTLLQATQATFVSLFITAKAVRKFGLPIKDFFIWGDDVEYTRRIAVRGGLRSFIVGNSTVTHDMAANTGSNIATDDGKRISRYGYAYRNECYLYRQEGFRSFAYFAAKCAYNTIRIIISHRDRTFLRLWTLIKSSICGMLFNPAVEFASKNARNNENTGSQR